MNLLNQLAKYNLWDGKEFELGFLRNNYLRKITKYLDNKLVKVITGQRRSGKSYFLRQIMNFLIKNKGINPKNIFYFSKEYIGFEAINTALDLDRLFKQYLNNIATKGKVYIFLDEVQNIQQWEKFVNSYSQDFTREYEIFITGSNSKLLSSELATYLSGRYIQFHIFPFSYDEFTTIYNLPKNRDSYLKYITTSGLPELLNLPEQELKRNYIESLKDTIILRDIVARYNIKDINLLEDLFKYLASNIGNLTSIPSIVKLYKSIGKLTLKLSQTTYAIFVTLLFSMK